jgi:hypothetical protein
MEYSDYQQRLEIRRRLDKELQRLDFSLRDPMNDPFDEQDIQMVNSKAWLHDIWDTYQYTRWSILEAFSYLELDYESAFLYYAQNVSYRFYALREKVAQLVNSSCNLGLDVREVDFTKVKDRLTNRSDIQSVFCRFGGNAHFSKLIEMFRHPLTHREDPYIQELDNYRFVMKKVCSSRVDLVAEKTENRWTLPELKKCVLRSYQAILQFTANVISALYKGETSIMSGCSNQET